MSQHDDTPVTQAQAESAVRTLLRWAGDDPAREGLLDTPTRVARAYRDWFSGYEIDPAEYLHRTFEEVAGYDLPSDKVVGISMLARVVDAFARCFQVQEKLTAQISHCIQQVLKPRGVGVVIEASHECMTTRGVHKRGVSMVTSQMLGDFREDARTRAEFMQLIRGSQPG